MVFAGTVGEVAGTFLVQVVFFFGALLGLAGTFTVLERRRLSAERVLTAGRAALLSRFAWYRC